MTKFSILIPTFNRREKLCVVLEELGKQKGIENGEVIVGIDGSTDGTEEMLTRILRNVRNLRIFRIENSGRAVIRNELLKRAQGELIIFIQDDIVVSEHWLEEHLNAHLSLRGSPPEADDEAISRIHHFIRDCFARLRRARNDNYAVVGHMTWYPKMEVTRYMRWLEHGGHMLDFAGLKDGQEIDFWHFYMGNISIPRSLVQDLHFDESLKEYGWEDILFGYEFSRRGHKIFYSKQALAWHWDEYREEDLPSYMQKLARSAQIAQEKYPGLRLTSPWWKRAIFHVMIATGSLVWPLLPQEWRWYVTMKREFLSNISKPH